MFAKFGLDVLLFLCICVLCIGASLFIPFFGFGNESYEEVCADAAKAYGLDINDFEITVGTSPITHENASKDKSGTEILGLYTIIANESTVEKQTIQIYETWSRPMVIATIFHEFAHAAQYKEAMDFGGLSIEQHAEILSAQKLIESKYSYNALHLFSLHLFSKGEEYRAPEQIAGVLLTDSQIITLPLCIFAIIMVLMNLHLVKFKTFNKKFLFNKKPNYIHKKDKTLTVTYITTPDFSISISRNPRFTLA